MRKLALGLVCAVAVAAGMAWAEGENTVTPPAATQDSPWKVIPNSALTLKDGPKVSIAGGGISGIAVDPTNGDVYAVLRNKGGVVKSEDQAASFKDYAPLKVGQGCMSTASLSVDPAGKRVAVFTIVDGLGGMTVDAGKTWTDFKGETDVKSEKGLGRCFDFGAVDWDGGGKAIIAEIHEGKPRGKTVLSTDGGATWKELGFFAEKGPVGIADEKTLFTAKPKVLQRSTDGGATWTKVADIPAGGGPKTTVNQTIYFVKGVGYLMTENGLMVSKDKGATWAVQGSAVKAGIGPLFGKDENHFAAIGAEGIYETKDGGKEWKMVAPLPPGLGPRDLSFGWDPTRDIFYAAQGGKPAMKCVVPKEADQK